MDIEVIFKDIVKPRLTIAKERVTLKIPSIIANPILITRLKEFAYKAKKELQPMIVNTLRGQIEIENKLSVRLSDDNEKHFAKVEE